jgi:hypothetical protein
VIPFSCSVCGQLLFFHNTTCLRCASTLGYDPDRLALDALIEAGTTFDAGDDTDEPRAVKLDGDVAVSLVGLDDVTFRRCENRRAVSCNWLVDERDDNPLCTSCRLTSIRPNDDDEAGLAGWADAELSKRRLIHQLTSLSLPIIDRAVDEERGVTFEFLSSRNRSVTTGHASGVITLDLSESDDAHREFVRQQLGEPYRTVLGHLRHEIGHYYWPHLVEDAGRIDEFRALFGDERVSYEDALAGHYADDPDEQETTWVDMHVSRYATMHPWEDWAETFAHYLHIQGGLETAESFGLRLGEPVRSAAHEAFQSDADREIGPTIESWLALTLALNGMSRSIGQDDLYPFVLSDTVIEKLDFVHHAVSAAAVD